MNQSRELHHQAVLNWLLKHEGELPRLSEIAKRLPVLSDAGLISSTLEVLKARRVIDAIHGTRAKGRGHHIIRIRATGKVLKTAGCPFELPAIGKLFEEQTNV